MIENFNPRNKKFHFKLSKYDCYKQKSGVCSLDNITIEELLKFDSKGSEYGESRIQYCRGMAKLFLENKFKAPADIYLNIKCGHYSCSGGQHRTCVVAHLLKKGVSVKLNVNLCENNSVCRYCLMQEEFTKRYKELSLLQKLMKTNNYKRLCEDKVNFQENEFIYEFD